MYICTCNSITKHAYFPRGIVMVTASYPEIIGHSVRVITVRGKTNQRREGVSSQYLNYTILDDYFVVFIITEVLIKPT